MLNPLNIPKKMFMEYNSTLKYIILLKDQLYSKISMKFVKKGVIMIDNPEDLKEKALANKPGLRRQYVNIPIGDEEYGFRISGIGAKAIKLEKYVKYDEIFEALEAGNENGLEAMVKQIIEDYEEENEEEAE